MSKTSKNTSYPQILPFSAYSVNGGAKTAVAMTPFGTQANYVMDPYEQQAYSYAQQEFAKNLQNLNVFSPQTQNGFNSQINAYKNSGMAAIDQMYTPMVKNLQNDIASRFGNLDNSPFLDSLSELESNRAKAVGELGANLEMKRQDLINNELQNRYDYLNFLNSYQNQVNQNIMSAFGLGQNLIQANNGYINNLYNAQRQMNSQNNNSDVLSSLKGLFGLAGKYLPF